MSKFCEDYSDVTRAKNIAGEIMEQSITEKVEEVKNDTKKIYKDLKRIEKDVKKIKKDQKNYFKSVNKRERKAKSKGKTFLNKAGDAFLKILPTLLTGAVNEAIKAIFGGKSKFFCNLKGAMA